MRGLAGVWRMHPLLSAECFYAPGEIAWLSPEGRAPDCQGMENLLGRMVPEGGAAPGALCLRCNASRSRDVTFHSSPAAAACRVAIDTAAEPPADVTGPGAELQAGDSLRLPPGSLLVPVSR